MGWFLISIFITWAFGGGGGLGGLISRHSWSSILRWRLCLASGLLYVSWSELFFKNLFGTGERRGGGGVPISIFITWDLWGGGGLEGLIDCLAQLEQHLWWMAVVLGIRPPKVAYIDKSNGSPCFFFFGVGGGGGAMYVLYCQLICSYIPLI